MWASPKAHAMAPRGPGAHRIRGPCTLQHTTKNCNTNCNTAFAKAPCFQTDEEPLVIGIIQSFLTCFELAGTKYVDLLSKNYYNLLPIFTLFLQ